MVPAEVVVVASAPQALLPPPAAEATSPLKIITEYDGMLAFLKYDMNAYIMYMHMHMAKGCGR